MSLRTDDKARLARDSGKPKPGRRLGYRHGMTRSRRYDAVRTAAGEWPWARGQGQQRLDLNRAIAEGKDPAPVAADCANRQPLRLTARVPRRALAARVTNGL